ncbi:MAG: hypothetical protein HS128_10165 [Ideonella sp.]|nr:hypothetical protein [Ideonella sp.]
MSTVVDMPSPYIATRATAAIPAPFPAATTSARESERRSAWSALDQALQEGDHPVAPSDAAVDEARAILDMLPSWVMVPEPVIEDSGTIAWVWDSVGKFLALAVNGTGTIQRSAIIDGQRSWATTLLRDRLSDADEALLAKFSSLHASLHA